MSMDRIMMFVSKCPMTSSIGGIGNSGHRCEFASKELSSWAVEEVEYHDCRTVTWWPRSQYRCFLLIPTHHCHHVLDNAGGYAYMNSYCWEIARITRWNQCQWISSRNTAIDEWTSKSVLTQEMRKILFLLLLCIVGLRNHGNKQQPLFSLEASLAGLSFFLKLLSCALRTLTMWTKLHSSSQDCSAAIVVPLFW